MNTWLIKINQRIYTTLNSKNKPSHFEILHGFSLEPPHIQREFATDQGWIVEIIEHNDQSKAIIPNQLRQVSRRIN